MRFLLILLIFISFDLFAQYKVAVKSPHTEPAPLFQFVENKKQWDREILFRADVPSGFLFLKNNGLHYGFYDAEAIRELRHPRQKVEKQDTASANNRLRVDNEKKYDIKAHGVTVSFLNANPTPFVNGKGETASRRNYFLGEDITKWASDVHTFAEVNYLSVYQGIDLRFFEQKERLKYEFVVGVGGNPEQIRLQYEGADNIRINEYGDLEITTSVHTFGEKKPYCYQIVHGAKVEVPSRFVLENEIVRFQIQDYNKSLPLVIDPQLVFSTFSGSAADNWGNTATYDTLGNLYTAGTVFGAGFPATVGAFQVNFAGLVDVGVAKYNPTGTRQLYTTHIGGGFAEIPHSIIVNHQNNLVILGTTSSLNFPTTFGAFDRTYNGGNGANLEAISGIPYSNGSDIFVSTLNENGSALLASTYLGGSGNDGINIFGSSFVHNYGDELRGEVNVDNLNNVYIASTTRSSNFPTQNATQTILSGVQDAIFVKMNPQLSVLQWSSYWGGNSLDVGYSIKLNKRNEIYVCGSTTSPNLRVSTDALRNSYQGSTDGYVARFDNSGRFLNASFLGTSRYDQTFFVDLDTANNVYVLGNTEGQYPVSQGVYNNPNSGQFIQKLNPTLTTSIWSTVIGARRGRPDLSLTAFLVNECGNIYVAGWGGNLTANYPANSTSAGLPVTADAIKASTDGQDFHITLLEREARSLLYGTFFGGNGGDGDHVDGGTCRFDKKGIIYHAACVCRTNRFFSTVGAWSNVNRAAPNFVDTGGCNNAAFKIDIGNVRALFTPLEAATNVEKRTGCAPLRIRFQNASTNAQEIEWNIGNLLTTQSAEPTYTFTQTGRYVVRLRVSNKITCTSDFAYDTIVVAPNPSPTITKDTIVCTNESLQLNATGGVTYRWNPTAGLNNPTISNPIAQPTQTTRYTVTVTNREGCSKDTSVLITIINPVVSFVASLEDLCAPSPTVRLTNNSSGTGNFVWDLGDGRAFVGQTPPPFRYAQTGNYRISLTARAGNCTKQFSQNLMVNVTPATNPITITQNTSICRGETLQLNATGGTTYRWSPATGLSDTNIPNPIAQPTQTTRYTVSIRVKEGCNLDTAVLITVPNPVANFTVNLDDICAASPTIRLVNNATETANFVWDLGNGQTFNGRQPPPFKYAQTGNYRVLLTAISGNCTNQFAQNVSVTVVPDTPFSISKDSTICNNESLQLNASGGTTYLWSPATGLSNSTIPNPIARPNVTTRYTVTINKRDGCTRDLSTEVRVVNPAAVNFVVNFDDFCDPFPTIRLVNTSPASANFTWDFGNGQTFRGQTPPPFKYAREGNYRIALTAQAGICTSQFSQNVVVDKVLFPNVITPNGDGKNETLVFNSPTKNLKIEIFNRWGKLVYQSENYQNDWKGEGIGAMYYYLITSPDGKTCKVWLNVFAGN
jgi:gliding motility-associated-like protein